MERQPTTDRMIQEYVPGKQVTLAHLIGFLDRFTGAVVLTGDVSAVEYALKQVTRTLGEMMQFTTCSITRT
ncbi:hypothetical protein I8U88_000909 [Salmonella enterica subsp. enterica serovar Infantis]|nr:hypothetical protein [Salmonella enterica subsp. enterica serovar Infantis]EIL4949661.1 hypothetical protein [Salmonella enterica]